MTAKETIDPDEILKFSKISDEWWDIKGKFSAYIKLIQYVLNLLLIK